MAGRLWWMLRWRRHPGVALLDGGYPKWLREKRPVNADIPAPHRGACACLPEPTQIVAADDVLRASQSGEQLILDARPDRRFSGEFEPLDPVAGHEPEANNKQNDENHDVDGTFLPPEALRENYQALLKGRPAWQVILMCGSGVTACHNILAMEVAGLPGSRRGPGAGGGGGAGPARPGATGE